MSSYKKYWGNNPRFKLQRSDSNNRFQMLSHLGDDVAHKIIKIPPIIVDNCYKFTHNNSFKLMLFGLPQISLESLKSEFKDAFNIELLNVKEITTTRSDPDDALYMMEFNRSQITKHSVIKIKYVYGTVVHWRSPQRRSRGPTECSKCAMYCHGSENCFKAEACLGCGGAHDYSNCQLNKTTEDGPVIYKCFNCMEMKFKTANHRADDPHCPSRKEYLQIRQRTTNSRKIRHVDIVSISSDDMRDNARGYEKPFSQKLSGKRQNNVSYA